MSVRAAIPGLAAGARTLDRDVSHYLCRVLRLRDGEHFVAFDPAARTEADATIDEASADGARVTIGEVRAARVVASAPLAVVYALAKGDKVDAVVRDASELGATHIVIARTSRSVAKTEGDRADLKLQRWRRIAEQAARQCGRADPPVIDGVLSWRDALATAAPKDDGAPSTPPFARFCLWENATEPLGAVLPELVARAAPMAFAIGPEGGLTAGEVDEARVLGYAAVSLGPFVLRTETVAAAVLGAVRVLARE